MVNRAAGCRPSSEEIRGLVDERWCLRINGFLAFHPKGTNHMPSGAPTDPSPISRLPARDYGAETHRNYRYQSAYAIVLLAAAAAKKMEYKAIWCEQEDDIVAQVDVQIKTQKPELGAWEITDDAFVNSVRSFLDLDRKFPGRFRRFHFVSNTDCLESESKDKNISALENWRRPPLTASVGPILLTKVDSKEDDLFRVFKKLLFAKGPGRDSFIA
ncbi:MAG: dsDNA nuclease domain-containing protein [Terriglobales bacterium]|jgi:hypothetical protein